MNREEPMKDVGVRVGGSDSKPEHTARPDDKTVSICMAKKATGQRRVWTNKCFLNMHLRESSHDILS